MKNYTVKKDEMGDLSGRDRWIIVNGNGDTDGKFWRTQKGAEKNLEKMLAEMVR